MPSILKALQNPKWAPLNQEPDRPWNMDELKKETAIRRGSLRLTNRIPILAHDSKLYFDVILSSYKETDQGYLILDFNVFPEIYSSENWNSLRITLTTVNKEIYICKYELVKTRRRNPMYRYGAQTFGVYQGHYYPYSYNSPEMTYEFYAPGKANCRNY